MALVNQNQIERGERIKAHFMTDNTLPKSVNSKHNAIVINF